MLSDLPNSTVNSKDVYVLKIYWQYTNRRVLTMEWITGAKLTRQSD